MRKTLKRLLTLSLLMILCVFPVSAQSHGIEHSSRLCGAARSARLPQVPRCSSVMTHMNLLGGCSQPDMTATATARRIDK